jgi:uncharacterized surface anchored protein
MNCKPNRFAYKLPDTDKGCTWDGLTVTIISDDTEYASALSIARFQLQTSTGTIALTLTSATAGEVTINDATAGQWSMTVESRVLTLDAGSYAWALETQDATGIVKKQLGGSLAILPEPVK